MASHPRVSTLVIFCWVTNYHKLSGLKQQQIYYLMVSMHQKSGQSLAESSVRVSLGWNQGVHKAAISSKAWSSLPSSLVVGRIQFLVIVRLKSPFSCWLLAGDYSQLLEATLGSLLHGPFHKQFITWCFTSTKPKKSICLALSVSLSLSLPLSFLTFYLEIIIKLQEVVNIVQRSPMYPYPVFLSGYILNNYSTMSNPGNWHWCNICI